MAIPRPLLLVLIASLVMFAAVTAVRTFGERGQEPATTQADSSPPSPAPPSTPGSGSRSPSAAPPAGRSGEAAAAKRAKKQAKGADAQSRVMRAIAGHKVVVLFFGQYRGADDRATRRAVRTVGRDRKQVAVFVDSINDVSDYPRVLAGLDVQQSPSTVVINRSGQARVVQGFLDTGSLRQLVSDARA